MLPRIYADFNNLDAENRLRLTCRGTLDDLKRAGIELVEGLRLTFYMDDADDRGQPDDLRVDGTVQHSPSDSGWVAVVDWSALRHASDESVNGCAPPSSANDNSAVRTDQA